MEINTLLINQWVKKDVTKEIKEYVKTNENGNTRYQNLWNAAKAVLRGKFIVINTYIKRKISNKPPNFKELEKNKLSLKLTERRK